MSRTGLHPGDTHPRPLNPADVACSDSVEDLLQEYPSISRANILTCFDYGASLAAEQNSM